MGAPGEESNMTETDESLEVEPLDAEQDETEVGLGTQAQMQKDPQWNGIPPVGNNPIPDRFKFLILILIVFGVKIIIW